MEVADIIDSVDILDYISQYTSFEERNGEYWALSPLKEENTPSFSVSKDKQYFYDFSSGTGGNILSFIQQYNHCDLNDAIRILKDYANINDSEHQARTHLSAYTISKKYKKHIKKIPQSKSVILEPDFMDRYEFNKDKLSLWTKEGIDIEVLRQHGVRYDNFSNRIVYPIYDLFGNIINVSGRTVDPDYKAKKLRKYTYFKPLGCLNTLYWLYQNREEILDKHELRVIASRGIARQCATYK